MPNFHITIHLKIGPPKQGVRWHPSYDVDHVRNLGELKIKKIIGMSIVQWLDIDIIGHTSGDRMETKNLTIE